MTKINQTYQNKTERNVIGVITKINALFVTMQVGNYTISMSHETLATNYSLI